MIDLSIQIERLKELALDVTDSVDSVDVLSARLQYLEETLSDRYNQDYSIEHGVLSKRLETYSSLLNGIDGFVADAEGLIEEGRANPDDSDIDELFDMYGKEAVEIIDSAEGFILEQSLRGKYDLNNVFVRVNMRNAAHNVAPYVAQILSGYEEFASRKGLEACLVEDVNSDASTCLLKIEGDYAYGLMKRENVDVSVMYENAGKRQTSRVHFDVFPEIGTEEYQIHNEDIKTEHLSGTGKGGQNVNRRSTSVRLTHKPTGISVKINGKSQKSNLEQARGVLESEVMSYMAGKSEEDVEKETADAVVDKGFRRYNFIPGSEGVAQGGNKITLNEMSQGKFRRLY